jgi:hypothetical protein
MSKGIPGCILIITDSEIKLMVSEELTYLGANEYICLHFLCTSLENLSHMNENAGPFLSSAFTYF